MSSHNVSTQLFETAHVPVELNETTDAVHKLMMDPKAVQGKVLPNRAIHF
jgi:hypothetical protein